MKSRTKGGSLFCPFSLTTSFPKLLRRASRKRKEGKLCYIFFGPKNLIIRGPPNCVSFWYSLGNVKTAVSQRRVFSTPFHWWQASQSYYKLWYIFIGPKTQIIRGPPIVYHFDMWRQLFPKDKSKNKRQVFSTPFHWWQASQSY